MLSWLCYILLVVNICYCVIFYLVATRVLEHSHELHGSKLTICRFIPTVARQVKRFRHSDSLESLLSFSHHSQHLIAWNRLFNNIIFPRSWMGSESIAHEAKAQMCYWLRAHSGSRNNNCFSKIQLVGQIYRDKTTLASKTRFSHHCFGFQSHRFSLLVGYTVKWEEPNRPQRPSPPQFLEGQFGTCWVVLDRKSQNGSRWYQLGPSNFWVGYSNFLALPLSCDHLIAK